MLYVWCITCAVVLVSLINGIFVSPALGVSRLYPTLVTVILTVAVIAADGLTAFLVNAYPSEKLRRDGKIYTVSRKEKNFYEKLKIRRWKDKIPELGGIKNFRKNKIEDPFNNEYVGKFLTEICYGEWTHFLSLFTGFVVLAFFPSYRWTIGLPVALVNVCMNLPSLFILRYNSFKLRVLYESNEKKAQRKKNLE